MSNNRLSRLVWLLILGAAVGLAGLMLGACGQQGQSTVPSTSASPSVQTPGVQTPAGQVEVTPESSPTVIPIPASGITLTWWTPEFFSPLTEGATGDIVIQQIAGFVSMNPDISVQPILKATHGKGGILDFLRTAKVAAPGVLPDVVTIDTSELAVAVQSGLLQPLDSLLSSDLRADLFPFAVSVGEFDGQWYAVQFEADLQHLVYDRNAVEQPPRTWADLLAGRASYIFPAAGREAMINDASLIQYLGAGGTYDLPRRQLSLAEQPLLDLLTFYQQAVQQRQIPFRVLTYDNVESCWPTYLAGEADMTNALASRYLEERAALADSGYAALPSRDGRVVTISSGWALAIVASDTVHQMAAARFVEWLLMPEHTAAWTQAAGRLPCRRSALAVWEVEDQYRAFLEAQLQAATFRPSGSANVEPARWLQQAVHDVLNGTMSPEDATQQALEAMGGEG